LQANRPAIASRLFHSLRCDLLGHGISCPYEYDAHGAFVWRAG
jgi:hypothetical protein